MGRSRSGSDSSTMSPNSSGTDSSSTSPTQPPQQ
jgi:hypothetical protein